MFKFLLIEKQKNSKTAVLSVLGKEKLIGEQHYFIMIGKNKLEETWLK